MYNDPVTPDLAAVVAKVRLTHADREVLRPILARYARWESAHDGPVFEAVEQIVRAHVAAAILEALDAETDEEGSSS